MLQFIFELLHPKIYVKCKINIYFIDKKINCFFNNFLYSISRKLICFYSRLIPNKDRKKKHFLKMLKSDCLISNKVGQFSLSGRKYD